MEVLSMGAIFKANIGNYFLGLLGEGLIAYDRNTPAYLLDAKSLLLMLSILIISIWFLWRQNFWGNDLGTIKKRFDNRIKTFEDKTTTHDDLGEEVVSIGRTTTTTTNSTNCTFSNSVSEDEADEEYFEKNWSTIRISGYRNLVVPPECKLVDVSSFLQKQKSKKLSTKDKEELDADENLWPRIMRFCKRLFSLFQESIRFTRFSTKLVVTKLFQVLKLPIVDKFNSKKDRDNTDRRPSILSTDESVQGSTYSTPKKERGEIKSQLGNKINEKDNNNQDIILRSKLKRRSSSDSFHEISFDDENDVGEGPLVNALDLSRDSTRKSTENFRSPYSQPLHNSSVESTPKRAKLNPSHKIGRDELHPSRILPVEELRIRADSESMSFFDAAHSPASLRKLHVEVPVPDRNGYILGDDFLINNKQTPILVFVNSRSGPRQGRILMGQLRRLLNPIQVWDLADGGPEVVLESFCAFTRLRILVCGGDGTVSWIISCLEKLKPKRWPPIAILPLGTGNDLARIHGWGGGYNNESLISILEQVAESYISLLDQWEIKIENKKGKIVKTKDFFNYTGIGADAQAALQVHNLRESKPELFFSRLFNKVWYLIFGVEEALMASNVNLPNEITLIADGVQVPLPPDSQGILLLNIDSYLGGVPMWSLSAKEKDRMLPGFHALEVKSASISHLNQNGLDTVTNRRCSTGSILQSDFFSRVENFEELQVKANTNNDKSNEIFSCDGPSSCQDGKLDIISIRGTFHLGQIQVGLGHGLRLCQANEVEVIVKKKLAVQIDGEPWLQNECRMKITRKKDAAVMLHRSPDESGGVETEVAKLLEWAENEEVIDSNAHAVLMKEFSKRIESKSRQRRVKSQDNLMLSLRRAIGGNTLGANSTFPGSLSF